MSNNNWLKVKWCRFNIIYNSFRQKILYKCMK